MRIGNTEIQPLTKNLLFINVILFLATQILGEKFGLDLYKYLAVRFPLVDGFLPTQLVSHMFMHGDFTHILFNMLFGVFMFGNTLEKFLGTKKYAILYFVSGFGAIALDFAIRYYHYFELSEIVALAKENYPSFPSAKSLVNTMIYNHEGYLSDPNLMQLPLEQAKLAAKSWEGIVGTLVGASGCIYGVLAAFGYLFPNQKMMLLFIPYPIAAKYFIPGILLMNLLFLVKPNLINSNIGYAAHIGGALFGFLLVIFWNRYNNKSFN